MPKQAEYKELNGTSSQAKIKLGPEHVALLLDPVKFVALCWPHITLTAYQETVLRSVAANAETLVHSANEMGKDFITAIVVIWFFCSRRPARVIMSSSGETQLKMILWSEIKKRLSDSQVEFPFKVNELEIKWLFEDGTECHLSYIKGHVTKSVENFQGHHLDHDKPRVLAVFDESSGIPDEFSEAAESWQHRKLAIGNPLNCLNWFYQDCKGGDLAHPDEWQTGLLRKIIHVDGEESPNVIVGKRLAQAGVPGPYPNVIPGVLSYDEYRRRLKIWDKYKIKVRLHGLFNEGDDTLLYPPEWLDNCERMYARCCPLGYETSCRGKGSPQGLAMGVDAGQGRDLTVWTIICHSYLIYQETKQTPEPATMIKRTIELANEFHVPVEKILFDAGGGGFQLASVMRGEPYRKKVNTVWFGESPTDRRPPKRSDKKEVQFEHRQIYKNKRAEMYDVLRQRIDPSINAEPFGLPVELYELRRDLAIMPLMWDNEGKMFLPPKDRKSTDKENKDLITIKKLLGRSPDRADSLVLAAFALWGQPARRKVGVI